jgi:hypothetical protein
MKKFPVGLYVTYCEGTGREPGWFTCSEKQVDAIMTAEDEGDDRVALYKLVELKKARTIRKLE